MPYTDDPQNKPSDAVRYLVGDTNLTNELLTDNEVSFLLADQGGSVLRAAARAAETLAAKFSGSPSEKKVGTLMIMYGTRAITRSDAYMKLAKLLYSRAARNESVPFAGGISLSDKLARAADTDRTRPSFRRRMLRYPRGEAQSLMPEEILSPPPEVP